MRLVSLVWLVWIGAVACNRPTTAVSDHPDRFALEYKEVEGDAVAYAGGGATMSFDGERMAIGKADSVLVYVRDHGTGGFTLEQTLDAPTASEGFGASVSLWGDRLVVGAPTADEGVTFVDIGAAYVYERNDSCGAAWCQVARLLPIAGPSSSDTGFGTSVSVFGDWLLIGMPTAGANDEGQAHLFRRTGACGQSWCGQYQLTSESPATDAHFGSAVAIDDGYAMIGEEGAASVNLYVLDESLSTCGTLLCNSLVDTDAGNLGAAVALWEDRAVAGAPTLASNGSTYIYQFDDPITPGCSGTWCRVAKTNDPYAAGGVQEGAAVAIHGDVVVSGEPYDGSNDTGRVHVIGYAANQTWQRIGRPIATTTADARFGTAVAVGDGEVFGSAPGEDKTWVIPLAPRGPGDLYDYGTDVDVVDQSPGSTLYSLGVNDSFGDLLGETSRLWVNSGECGGLVFGFQLGPAVLTNDLVVYLDTAPGGTVSSTLDLSDGGDANRRAISAYRGGVGGGYDHADVQFPTGFSPEYAIAVSASFAGLWKLDPTDDFTFVRTLDGSPPAPLADTVDFVEVGLDLSDLGLSAGDTFEYIAAAVSETGYVSNEFHGVEASGLPPYESIGWGSAALPGGSGLALHTVAGAFDGAQGPDALTVDEGADQTVDLLANDSDPSGLAASSVQIVTQPAHGSVSVTDGVATYTHDGSETTGDSFSYTVDDACGNTSDPIAVTVTVNPTNDPPALSLPAGTIDATEDQSVAIGPCSLTDPDLGSSDLTLAISAVNGTVTLASTANLVIDSGADGTAQVTIRGTQADVNAAITT